MSVESVLQRVAALEQALTNPAALLAAAARSGGTAAPAAILQSTPEAAATSSGPSFADALQSASAGYASTPTAAGPTLASATNPALSAATSATLATPSSGLSSAAAGLAYPSSGVAGVPALSALAPTFTPTAPGGSTGARIVAIAESQLGQAEQPPGSNESPAIAQYRGATAGAIPGAPWCAYFASWAARQAGAPLGAQGEGLGSVAADLVLGAEHRPRDRQRAGRRAPARRSDRLRRRARRHRQRRAPQWRHPDGRGQLRKQGLPERPQPDRSDRLREHELKTSPMPAPPTPPLADRRDGGRRRDDPLRVGVIGAGSMGAHHIRAYSALGGQCALYGIHDRDRERCATLAQQFDTRACDSIEELLAHVQAVSICTPSALHVEHALLALRAGVDVLIEKPVALSVSQAAVLGAALAADPRGPVAQVGHIEHFNPAVREVSKLLRGERMVALELQRLSPFDGRILDADVVQDLMLHDIHVLLTLAGSRELCGVHAVGRRVRSPQLDDYAVATLTFEDGLIGTLVASRITEEKIRRLSATTEQSHITVDYLRRTVERCRSTQLEEDGAGSRTYRQESLLERVFVPLEEPLLAQLRSFLHCVRERTAPEVDLQTAVRCLSVVQAIRDSIAGTRGRLQRQAVAV